MKKFEFVLTYAVYHNNIFHHNIDSYRIDYSEFGGESVKRNIFLKKGKTYKISDDFIVRTDDQYIACFNSSTIYNI